ncbi:type I restriction-modification system%2C DNA-methyltransferase subunit M [Streptococcus pneumoniae]|nr:type I restriction-modification system%2C DNA-methyltransferase subunit M [Streptococcus pneumoniae]COP93696.1 type I restriction-modification system%2C DNA-methyltransferase subunit M [Streptococcus pneumoniae]
MDTFEEEEEISLVELSGTMQQTQQKLQQVEQNLFAMLNELEGTNEDAQQELQRFIQTLGGGKNE